MVDQRFHLRGNAAHAQIGKCIGDDSVSEETIDRFRDRFFQKDRNKTERTHQKH